jgi:hypothetical protein
LRGIVGLLGCSTKSNDPFSGTDGTPPNERRRHTSADPIQSVSSLDTSQTLPTKIKTAQLALGEIPKEQRGSRFDTSCLKRNTRPAYASTVRFVRAEQLSASFPRHADLSPGRDELVFRRIILVIRVGLDCVPGDDLVLKCHVTSEVVAVVAGGQQMNGGPAYRPGGELVGRIVEVSSGPGSAT